MILYGVPFSPFVRKTLFTLYELNLDFEQSLTFPQSEEIKFRLASPLGRIPALTGKDFQLVDSSAICHYLIKQQKSQLIDYGCAESIANNVSWDKFADDDLHPALFDILLERTIKPVRFGEKPDNEIVETAIHEKIPKVFNYLERSLKEGDKAWLMGDKFSYADIAIGAHLSNLIIAKTEIDFKQWPTLKNYLKRLSKRDAFIKICQDALQFKP